MESSGAQPSEGVIIAARMSDATDNAIQANRTSIYKGRRPALLTLLTSATRQACQGERGQGVPRPTAPGCDRAIAAQMRYLARSTSGTVLALLSAMIAKDGVRG